MCAGQGPQKTRMWPSRRTPSTGHSWPSRASSPQPAPSCFPAAWLPWSSKSRACRSSLKGLRRLPHAPVNTVSSCPVLATNFRQDTSGAGQFGAINVSRGPPSCQAVQRLVQCGKFLLTDMKCCRASEDEWRLVMPAVMAACSAVAAQAWLGHVPAALSQAAVTAAQALQSGVQPSSQQFSMPAQQLSCQLHLSVSCDTFHMKAMLAPMLDCRSERYCSCGVFRSQTGRWECQLG